MTAPTFHERLRAALNTEPHFTTAETVATVMRVLGEQHGDLRDQIAQALCSYSDTGGKPRIVLGTWTDLADAVLPVAEAWAAEQTQRADQADKRAARAEAMVVLYRLQEDDPDSLVQRLDNAEAAVQRLERLRDKWLAFPADDMHHAAGDMLARWLDHDPERPEVRDA